MFHPEEKEEKKKKANTTLLYWILRRVHTQFAKLLNHKHQPKPWSPSLMLLEDLPTPPSAHHHGHDGVPISLYPFHHHHGSLKPSQGQQAEVNFLETKTNTTIPSKNNRENAATSTDNVCS